MVPEWQRCPIVLLSSLCPLKDLSRKLSFTLVKAPNSGLLRCVELHLKANNGLS